MEEEKSELFAIELTKLLQKYNVYFTTCKDGIEIRKCNTIITNVTYSKSGSGHPYPLLLQAIN